MKILLTGGAGYIGSFMAKRLLDDEHEVTIVDNLERGDRDIIDLRAKFILGDLKDLELVKKVFIDSFDIVIHFAGYISMEESTKDPFLYFQNNTLATLNILEIMKQ